MVSWMWAISGTEMRDVAALIGERWHRLAAESDASSRPWKHAFGPNQAQAGALPVGGGYTGALALWFMPASRPHQAPMGWKPLSRGNKSVGSASWQLASAGQATPAWGAHGVMSLYYDIGTHQSKPHTRSSGGVLVPHSAPQGTWMAREHPTWSWRPKQPKWFWRSRPPRSSNPNSCHQESDSKTVRCDGCNKRPANHLISPSSSEWLHVVAHGSVGAAQPAENFGTRLLLPKTPICT